MSLRKSILAASLSAALVAAPLQTHAQGIPVIDIAAIANLIQQIDYWRQQIASMTSQLDQARQTYNSMTGGRGMETLLNMTNQQRNYLPPDYVELLNVVNGGSSAYAGLSGQLQAVISANAVLSSAQMSSMSPQQRETVESGRKAAAMLATISQSAYQNTSQRFAALQGLINMIGAAADPKAIQDLQGRVQAEQTMLTNEQNKLQTLFQIAQSEQWAQKQRVREQVIQSHGGFGSRFSPTP